MKQIVRDRNRNARTLVRKRRIRHDVMLQSVDKAYSCILASSTIFRQFVVGLGFQSHTHPLDAGRIASVVKQDASDADARIVATRNKPRKEIELPVGTTDGRGVEHALHLVRVIRPRLHNHPQTL